MKKTFLFLSFTALFAACTNNSYEIKGNISEVEGKQEGWVYIKQRVVRDWVTLDSALVEQGAFVFSGTVVEPYAAYLHYANADGRTASFDFIVEPGNIVLHIDSTFSRTGTKQNDLLQALYDNGAESDNIEPEVEFILANANSAVANYVFTRTYYMMSVEQKEQIIAALTPKSLQYDRIPMIAEAMEIEKKTNVGQPFTDIVLPNADGVDVALSSFVGNTDYVLIDFWASWCGPCRRAFPELTALYNKYKDTGKFEIFGVSLDAQRHAWLEAIEKDGLVWPHVSDLKGWECLGAQLYAVNSIPSTILINKEGIIIARNVEVSEIEEWLTK